MRPRNRSFHSQAVNALATHHSEAGRLGEVRKLFDRLLEGARTDHSEPVQNAPVKATWITSGWSAAPQSIEKILKLAEAILCAEQSAA